ncbi:MAG: DNA starvation/stationary phase protection protein [Anaerolineaceae bacterium]|jgi:starvation-inducible DNA-binding protein|nr:DNA starvation/stationary phase protection protein [Anaerolineaceae bacterium]
MGRKQNNVLNTKPLDIDLPVVEQRNDGLHPQKKIFIQPNIGLESDVRIPVIEILNASLANEAVLTQKTRGAHWNVSGTGFFELHILFETQYKQLNEISDKIAGRVRMLGGITIASFEEFLKHTRILEHSSEIPDYLHLLADHETIIRFLRDDIRKCNEEYEDEGTVELLVGVMSLHEKMAWMLRAYIENESDNIVSQKRKK